MKIKILIHQNKTENEVTVVESAYCLIGRKNANVIIDDPRCSQQHVLFYQGPDNKLWMKDLESTNGTFVNGKKTTECVLYAGDEIKIGRCKIAVLDFRPATEKTSVTVRSRHSVDQEGEATKIERSAPRTGASDEKPGEVVTQWPENILAAPKPLQDKFVDYVDEEGTTTRIRLKDLLKAA